MSYSSTQWLMEEDPNACVRAKTSLVDTRIIMLPAGLRKFVFDLQDKGEVIIEKQGCQSFDQTT